MASVQLIEARHAVKERLRVLSLRKVPFLKHLPEPLSKVDLGFLKGLNTSEKPDPSGRE
jgi:hypothetical protein